MVRSFVYTLPGGLPRRTPVSRTHHPSLALVCATTSARLIELNWQAI